MKKILVIKLGALGDFIYSCGAMRAIREYHGHDHITLLTTKTFVKMAEKSGYFNDIVVDERPKWANISGWLALRAQLNRGAYARVYDLQNNDRTGFYKLLFTPQPEWAGSVWGATFRNRDKTRTQRHAFYGLRDTLKLAGIDNVMLDGLRWMKSDITRFQLPEKYMLMVAGSAPTRPDKRWPVESFCAVAKFFITRGITPVILGTSAESEAIMDLQNLPHTLNLVGKTELFDLADLARGAVMAIGNDTGPMHIAAVTGCKVIVLYNTRESTVAQNGPQGPHVRTLEAKDLKIITVDQVLAEAGNFLL
jgi:ADP-heptose:LPS heptosyltransferase